MFKEITRWHTTSQLERVKKKLENNGFDVVIIDDKSGIETFLRANVAENETVGIGGSATIRELEIDKKIAEMGNTLFDHWQEGLKKEDIIKVIRSQPTSDCFIASTNALTVEGQLINIDTTGNRVASMIFGPKKVILFVGANKIVDSIETGLSRVKNTACPMNSKRKGLEAPCEQIGHCIDCHSNKSICKITTIIEKKPPTIDYKIVLLPFDLGF